MFNLKKIAITSIVVLTAFFSFFSYAQNKSVAPATDKTTSYLFIQSAKWGILSAGKQPGTYNLTLYKVDPYITYFTDRPVRQTGLLDMGKFFSKWNVKNANSFAQNAPNVDIEGVKLLGFYDNKGNVNIVFTLNNPSYDAKEGKVVYKATALSGDDITLKQKVIIHNVKLFFDNLGGICLSCS